MASMAIVLVLCFFLFTLRATSETNVKTNMKLVPALYVFGDSTVDGGNTFVQPPYGIDLDGTEPIRWSNGETMADFIAIFLGLPIVPPYNNASEAENLPASGVNYGYAGSGILKETGPAGWTFADQIYKFNSTIENNLTELFDQQQLGQHLKDSIFLVSFGINDYAVNFLSPTTRTFRTLSPDVFSQLLLKELSDRLETLYSLGARKFMINNIWPLGCTPKFFLNLSDPRVNCCNETINQLLLPYNNTLPLVLEKLESSLVGSLFSSSDNFKFVRDLKENTEKYGITNTTGGCLSNSIQFSGTPCNNRDQYLYFDAIHTTEAANRVFSVNCLCGTLCGPRNILRLVGA